MKRHAAQINETLTQAALASRLENAPVAAVSHFTVPAGAATSNTQLPFMAGANDIRLNDTHANALTKAELTFGAPQIDLALPSGSLISAGLHQFNPRHFRDQTLAVKCALALAARRLSHDNSAPIFCFVSQDQTELLSWLSEQAATTLGIENDRLVIVTAKHSDDLLWAIEETMHGAAATAIVAHVPLVDNLCAQRIAFTARTKGVPALIATNHRIGGPDHTASTWSIEQLPADAADLNDSNANNEITARLTAAPQDGDENQRRASNAWIMKWRSDRLRFAAKPCQAEPAATVH